VLPLGLLDRQNINKSVAINDDDNGVDDVDDDDDNGDT